LECEKINEKTIFNDFDSGLGFNMGLFGKIFIGDNDDYKANLRNDVPHLLKSVCSFYSNLL
jgi:hypothetical protein